MGVLKRIAYKLSGPTLALAFASAMGYGVGLAFEGIGQYSSRDRARQLIRTKGKLDRKNRGLKRTLADQHSTLQRISDELGAGYIGLKGQRSSHPVYVFETRFREMLVNPPAYLRKLHSDLQRDPHLIPDTEQAILLAHFHESALQAAAHRFQKSDASRARGYNELAEKIRWELAARGFYHGI